MAMKRLLLGVAVGLALWLYLRATAVEHPAERAYSKGKPVPETPAELARQRKREREKRK